MRQKVGRISRTATKKKSVRKPKKGLISFVKRTLPPCEGIDCTRYILNPFVARELARFKEPMPPIADRADAEIAAAAELELRAGQSLIWLRRLEASGDFFAGFFLQLLRGGGGPEVCQSFGSKCVCQLEKSRAVELPRVSVPVDFNFKGARYTAIFLLRASLRISPGKCMPLPPE